MELVGKDLYINVMARYALALAYDDKEGQKAIYDKYIKPYMVDTKKDDDLSMTLALVLVDIHRTEAEYRYIKK